MGFRNEIEEILKIQDVQEKLERIDDRVYELSENRSVGAEEVGEATALLLQKALGEQNQEGKEAMFDLLATAVSWHQIETFIDWDAILAQIPHLAGNTLLSALEILGWSKDKRYIPLLERHLDSSSIWVQITALEALSQIWWDFSAKNDDMKKYMKIEAITQIRFLLTNPQTHHISEAHIQKQLSQFQHEFIANMRNWFETQSGNAPL